MMNFLLAALSLSTSNPEPVTRYVDPMVGTAATGHTFPGAVRPHGMVQLSPDTGFSGWEHASGYHHDDNVIMGFSHMHLSGTGGSDFGDILVAPSVGEVQLEPGDNNKPGDGYHSRFDHKQEVARAGYYSVFLQDPKVEAELTVTPRVGIHRYSFPATEKANLTFEITNQIGGQERTFSSARWISPTELEGTIFTRGWAKEQHTYFVARFSRAATSYGVAVDNKLEANRSEASGALPRLDAYATFDTRQNSAVMVKVGLSAVEIGGARKNLDAEAKHWDFARYVREADGDWAKKLSQTQIKGGTDAQKRDYYTALYHSYIHPSLYQDVDGRYLGMDMKTHQAAPGFVYHHIYSLWDTYRAAHPLFQLTEPTMNAQFVNGMLERYKIRGELPIWELASNETYTMIGTSGVPVVANAIVNEAPGIDKNLAFKAVTDSLEFKQGSQDNFLQWKYVPSDIGNRSVSKTLEFAYDNGAAAKMAQKLGKTTEANTFWTRSQWYHNVFNPEKDLIWPKNAAGEWLTDFDPILVNGPHITQANSWEYGWNMMHDVPGLIALYGGRDAFIKKLQLSFDPSNKPTGDYHGMTGLIGQYNHGNEPGHHVPYLFALAGRPDLTQKTVQRIRSTLYFNGANGLPGNDDCGQTSAWYVFSALGFYPVDPASGEYVLGVPLFPEANLKLENGKVVRIVARGFDPSKETAKSVRWNGKLITNNRIRHADLMRGGTLEFRK
ncbi:alpha-1,2-mannosidase, putative [Abditibacterium utsteinense]|uniref:Alpha-1,2-mannosidase, putative n=1 Tax=Abditibacterium utsteinense TaxID=1960156 RepID=A0A2S8SRB1_9BACT|nr:GH92 family glycosyl hydrolase [Abditibacterium utsteinense]PQV63343.1 alpha-1,2-mannosidase, putative [Abditibacterium utsteinense]